MVIHKFTWTTNNGKNSCINFIMVNHKLYDYLNTASLYNYFNDISYRLLLILFCKQKYPFDGFTSSPSEKKIRKLNCLNEFVWINVGSIFLLQ